MSNDNELVASQYLIYKLECSRTRLLHVVLAIFTRFRSIFESIVSGYFGDFYKARDVTRFTWRHHWFTYNFSSPFMFILST